MVRLSLIAAIIAIGFPSLAASQTTVLAPVPGQVVYEYQLNYQLPWQRWYGGPGLSLGGTMPTQGAIGYSSLNGIPFPGPLGSGVYLNPPAPGMVGVPVPPVTPAFGPRMFPGLGSPTMPALASTMGLASSMPMMGGAPPTSLAAASFQQSFQQPGGQGFALRRPPVQRSTPNARRLSLEQQNLGDEKLRAQQWTAAYVHFRNAADLAPDRPEAHFRLGLSFAVLRQFASAVREFKRSVELDAALPQSGNSLTGIFGEENQVVGPMIVTPVSQWAREDLTDTDRLFLLGMLLSYNDDPRGSEILEGALRTPGPKDHVLALLTAVKSPREPVDRHPGRSAPTEPFGPNGDAIPPAPSETPTLAPPGVAPNRADPFPDPPPT